MTPTLTLTLATPTQGAYQLEACICQPGYYGVDNTCAVCADGAECPGGNLMRARAGWCEVKNPVPGVASLFRHCCKPDLCPGGVAAVCNGSTALVSVDDCAEAYDLNRDPRRDLCPTGYTCVSDSATAGIVVGCAVAGIAIGFSIGFIRFRMPGPTGPRAHVGASETVVNLSL